MPDDRINPFEPGATVSPGMFVGRSKELNRVIKGFAQTIAGKHENFLIVGERGIGKSSFLNYLRYVAEGSIPANGNTINFLVIDTDISEKTTQLDLVKKIEMSLNNALAKDEKTRAFFKDTWAFLKKFEAAGVSLKNGESFLSEELMTEEFSYSLANTIERVINKSGAGDSMGASYDGVLLLIDETDNASKELNFGSFIKLLIERLERRGIENFMVCFAGIHDIIDKLRESHASSLRLFTELSLDRLDDDEIELVIQMALKSANKTNTLNTSITSNARTQLVSFAEGYPHFIQQFGYSAFETDTDGKISKEDVLDGAIKSDGAIEEIGNKYYRDSFYIKIKKDSYRQVLRIMAEESDGWVSKSDIKEKFTGKDSTLDNAIAALRNRGIILSKLGEIGVYRLQHKGFALWIKIWADQMTQ